ncbi:SDR family NAD(P)-dependent oxidoreductase [Catenuloplanes japonicus]|uniref:SDR family NAD(P)-dependent oxidoreductase n=1 Tax=Catenuloplanes japonicus TaxID=33876 RepID=UPI000527B8D2|nr:SDR family NAD(P)-dependent oxidoreductase [Catenuloplanes japonicus]
MGPEADELAACLRVLAALTEDPADPALAEVRAAVDLAYRAGKKQRKAARHTERRARDLALLATATRFHDENPTPAPAETRKSEERRLYGGRRCYVCKQSYRDVDTEYHLLCPDCAVENLERRHARADLTGRRVMITGGRIKIGFQTALKALRDGADVLVTTRFPVDAARRFGAVPDAAKWLDQLWIHGADFLDLPGVLALTREVEARWGTLDILINNAAQTIRRPPEYHREVRAAEHEALTGPAATITRTGGSPISGTGVGPIASGGGPITGTGGRPIATGAGPIAGTDGQPITRIGDRSIIRVDGPASPRADAPPISHAADTAGIGSAPLVPMEAFFPVGLRDETGEPLDLRGVNSWVLGVADVSPAEWLETHVINAFVPFLLTGRLKPLMIKSPHPDRYVVQVSAMEGVFQRPYKTPRHPHTNMAKAGLNMLTRTVAAEYAADGIHMCSVDTGWITDERPHPGKTAQREAGFRPPLDVIDGAARVYDPIVRGVRGEPVHGVFLKDYREAQW